MTARYHAGRRSRRDRRHSFATDGRSLLRLAFAASCTTGHSCASDPRPDTALNRQRRLTCSLRLPGRLRSAVDAAKAASRVAVRPFILAAEPARVVAVTARHGWHCDVPPVPFRLPSRRPWPCIWPPSHSDAEDEASPPPCGVNENRSRSPLHFSWRTRPGPLAEALLRNAGVNSRCTRPLRPGRTVQ